MGMAKNFKCEDALPADLCAKLKDLAAKIQVKAAEVDKVLRDIVAKGITKAKEIFEKIRQKLFPALDDEVLFELEDENAMKCEDVISAEVCQKLRETAAKLKEKAAVVDKLVREAVKAKITEAKAIAKQVREKLATMAKNFKCEDALPADICAKLKDFAERVKVKAGEVDKVLREIVAKGITKAKEIIEKIREKLFPAMDGVVLLEMLEMNALTCEDVLSEKICTELRDAAAKLKEKAKVIDELVRQAVKEKITEAKAVAQRVRQKLVDMAKNFKCEDAIPGDLCAKLKDIAERIKVKASEVDKLLKDIIAKGVTKAKEIIEKIRQKLFPADNEMELIDVQKCEDILAEKVCAELREAAQKLKMKAEVIDQLIRHTIEKKITEAKAVIEHVRKDLVEKAKNFKCEDLLPP